jgi:molecular chaperone DnaK (HSP70)
MSEIVPRSSPYVLGIDLGTSNSAVSVYFNQKAEIIPVDGVKTCPSVVNVRDNGEVVVGRQAKAKLMIDPENTVVSVKRDMGTDWTKEFAGLPGKQYSPADISAMILEKLKAAAGSNEQFSLRGTPKYAVICIPANFTDTQKQATKQAGELANLQVLRLLEEPVAAAIAYALERNRDQTILVYDLGGGTFDVSILNVKSNADGQSSMEIKAKAGVPRLGGDDFDQKIMEMAAVKLAADSNIDILDLKKDQGISKKALREAQQKLKEAAETAKIELSEMASTDIAIPNIVKDESGNLHNLDFTITRDEFNAAIRDLLLQSKDAITRALDEAAMTIDDISRIILVGGSTKVPLVREMLTEMFGKEPYGDVDPDTVVARGAAIFGASLQVVEEFDPDVEVREEDKFTGTIELIDRVTHYLGIETYGNKFSCLLDKGLDIPKDAPISVSKEYATPRDNMTELTIRIYQSDRSVEYVTAEGVNCIGEFFLTGIPPKPRGAEHVTVTFSIDQQNMLAVKASSSSSSGELTIERSGTKEAATV